MVVGTSPPSSESSSVRDSACASAFVSPLPSDEGIDTGWVTSGCSDRGVRIGVVGIVSERWDSRETSLASITDDGSFVVVFGSTSESIF